MITTEGTTLLREHQYYLFCDLGRILDQPPDSCERVKDFIMESFWLKRLSLFFYAKNTRDPINSDNEYASFSDFYPVEQKTLIQVLKHHGFIEAPRKNHSDAVLFKRIAVTGWSFFARIIDSDDFWTKLIVPNLALNIFDLQKVLQKHGLNNLIKRLPKKDFANQRRDKQSTQQRNEKICDEYMKLKQLVPQSSDIQIAEFIAEQKNMNKETVKTIICKAKKYTVH